MARRAVIALVLVMVLLGAAAAQATDDLVKGFTDPPDAAKPWVYWWWLNSNVSREGITRDLEEMKSHGIAGALIFDAGVTHWPYASERITPAPFGPVFMGDEWRALVKHAAEEADRLGLTLGLNLCSGWNAGGPWITPRYASQRLYWSETRVEGPRRFDAMLPLPDGLVVRDGKGLYCGDVTVLAYRTRGLQPFEMKSASAQITASSAYQGYDVQKAIDGDLGSFWVSNGYHPGEGPTPDRPEWLEVRFPEPFRAASLAVVGREKWGPRDCELAVSEDGRSFQTVCPFVVEDGRAATVNFDEVTSRIFRLVMKSSYDDSRAGPPSRNVQVRELVLLRHGERPRLRSAAGVAVEVPEYVDLRREDSKDLSEKVDASGRLPWDVPEGKWTVLRFGYGPDHSQIKVQSPGGEGFEADHLSAEAFDFHFRSMAEKIFADVGPLVGKSLKYLHDDSWEVGKPNWTASFPEEFRRRRGYDLLPFLPVIAGRTVDSPEVSQRFLHDFNRTIGDLIAENWYGRMRYHADQLGMKTHPESCCPGHPAMDVLRCAGLNDVPMGEFWARNKPGDQRGGFEHIKVTASAAHVYGRPVCQAEAFTSWTDWQEGPFDLKDIVDRAFSNGLTRVVYCAFAHSPYDAGKPGYDLYAGTHFNPRITWWEQGVAFSEYLARCQHLLRQGLFVADLCYYCGEERLAFAHYGPPRSGFDFDVINPHALLTRAGVKDGRIVLPDGMSYRLLVLPQDRAMSPDVLRKIKQLVEAGATVVGPKPERAPGLTDYPQCDEEIKKLAKQLWDEVDGQAVQERRAGQGRIVWGKAPAEILASDGVPPDFQYDSVAQDADLDFIHRTCDTAEIYFVSNQKNRPEQAECTFRVTGKQPEIWDAVTGECWEATDFRQEDGRTVVPLEFAPRQSWFVVFRGKGSGFGAQGSGKKNFPTMETVAPIEGPWHVAFDPKWGGPESVVFNKLEDWTTRPEPGIKHYSGKATYAKTFDLPESARDGKRLYLDLGRVENVAEVRLNGQRLGVVWTAPWRVEITRAVRAAGNELEIEVVNLWPNRLIGDAALPPEKRLTVTNVKKFKPDSPLLESGLLGPVTLQVAR